MFAVRKIAKIGVYARQTDKLGCKRWCAPSSNSRARRKQAVRPACYLNP
jgi:hypothetical protein